MTQKQLKQIEEFVTPYYQKTGKFHGWDHITSVRNNAKRLSVNYPEVNILALDAACLIHDIGRTIKDEGHPQESARLAKPFLQKIGLPANEIELILHAVSIHSSKDIYKAKTIEDKLLFDADKLEILSVYGFMRVALWLIEERNMTLEKAIDFLWKYCQKVYQEGLQTAAAKKIIAPQMRTLSSLVQKFQSWTQI
jgi:uncharacterized protein